MSEVIVPDVREQPWSTDATVVVDVASLTHTVAEAVLGSVGLPSKVRLKGRMRRTKEFLEVRRALLHNLHRIVDVLEHHGVATGRLLLSVPLAPFPPAMTGWRFSSDGTDQEGEQERTDFLLELAGVEERTRRELRMAGRDGVEVRALDAYFSADGEHCVDEQCVIAATLGSWTDPTSTAFVLSWDADVSVAPWLAGDGRILLTRHINGEDERAMLDRLDRHRPEHIPGRQLPEHLRLMRASLRLLVHPQDIPTAELREHIARWWSEPLPPVALRSNDDGGLLVDTTDERRPLSRRLGTPHPTRWFDLRRTGLTAVDEPCAAIVVVDSFGLMTTANRAGIPALVPSVTSVERALAPLGIKGRLGQLAVIPDILNRDHGSVMLSETVDGHPLEPMIREALSAPLRNGIRTLDEENQKAIDTYRNDSRPWTIATTSVFLSTRLARIGRSPVVLEEKESTVLLAADIMWALLETDLPVIMLTDRADLVVALHLIEQHIGPERRMRERLVRVGFHTDTFRGEGIPVERSREDSPWTTVLLTARMIADLLRLDASRQGDPAELPQATDLVAFDPISGMYDSLDAAGQPHGSIPIAELAKLPLSEILPLVGGEADDTAERRERMTAALELHLDLRTPLPRPRLLRRERQNPPSRAVRADEESAEVMGHALGNVRIRRAPGNGQVRRDIEAPLPGYLPPSGSEVTILVQQDGDACTIVLPDLSTVPAESGRPRPATITDGGRARLEAPLDPDDRRDDVGDIVRIAPLHGPFPGPRRGDVVLVTHLAPDRVQAVSTAITWRTPPVGTVG
jgi:hypothetical protein